MRPRGFGRAWRAAAQLVVPCSCANTCLCQSLCAINSSPAPENVSARRSAVAACPESRPTSCHVALRAAVTDAVTAVTATTWSRRWSPRPARTTAASVTRMSRALRSRRPPTPPPRRPRGWPGTAGGHLRISVMPTFRNGCNGPSALKMAMVGYSSSSRLPRGHVLSADRHKVSRLSCKR